MMSERVGVGHARGGERDSRAPDPGLTRVRLNRTGCSDIGRRRGITVRRSASKLKARDCLSSTQPCLPSNPSALLLDPWPLPDPFCLWYDRGRFHGSAAYLAAIASEAVNLIAITIARGISGAQLLALPHSGIHPQHRFYTPRTWATPDKSLSRRCGRARCKQPGRSAARVGISRCTVVVSAQ
jgi:hypothetical protein